MILNKTNTKEASLMAFALFNLSLIAFRMAVTQSLFYGFLIWNLALAGVPYLISWYLGENPQYAMRKIPLLFFSGLWLLFLPNAPYLVTDFLHFKCESNMPDWFDVLLLMSFSWNGIALGFVSMSQIHGFWKQSFGIKTSWLMIAGCSLLAGFGIYLGRFLRYNSWDILHRPIALVTDIAPLAFELRSIGFSIGYGLFVLLCYCFFKIHSSNPYDL